jgi:two-component system chemotaxis response regulator CheB
MLDSNSHLEVVGYAENGLQAIDKVKELKPDVVTMDIEMPVMDGISAVKRIMKECPVPILMFSSLTTDGAQATLDAIDAGAIDYLPKRFEDISNDREEAKRVLCARVRLIGARGLGGGLAGNKPAVSPASTAATAKTSHVSTIRKRDYDLLAIGTSTGGPIALQDVLKNLPANFSLPIVLIQHMPGSFTPAFAERLDKLCKINVREAKNGDELKPATALLAPGGKQMMVEKKGNRLAVRVFDGDATQTYKPSVDITFGSASKAVPGKVLAVVLTGMGADGRDGARMLKEGGSSVWSQDEASCVVYGMPAAIAEAGLADAILPLTEIGKAIVKGTQ